MTVSTSCIQFSDGSIDSAAVAEIADNRAVIDQAKGMLILLYGVDDESAPDMLRRRSLDLRARTSNCEYWPGSWCLTTAHSATEKRSHPAGPTKRR